MSTQKAHPFVGQPLSQWPLDRLKMTAQDGPDAATRKAAQAEIDARLGAKKGPAAEYEIVTRTSAYGTLQPQMLLVPGDGMDIRELRAVAYDCAARAERMLARGNELWSVVIAPDFGGATIVVELMDGTDAEAERAMALLRACAPAQGPKKRGRKPARAPEKLAAAPAKRTNGSAVV